MIDLTPDMKNALREVFREEMLPEIKALLLNSQKVDSGADFIRSYKELASRWGKSLSTVYRLAAKPSFPKKGPLGWRTNEIEAWENKKKH